MVELVDLYPTLSDLAGLPGSSGAEGVSFAHIVKDPAAPGETAAFSQYPRGQYVGYSIRTSRYRYTEWRNRDVEQAAPVAVELYDYEAEGEQRNVAGDSAYQDDRENLRIRLGVGAFTATEKRAR